MHYPRPNSNLCHRIGRLGCCSRKTVSPDQLAANNYHCPIERDKYVTTVVWYRVIYAHYYYCRSESLAILVSESFERHRNEFSAFPLLLLLRVQLMMLANRWLDVCQKYFCDNHRWYRLYPNQSLRAHFWRSLRRMVAHCYPHAFCNWC